jgi:predicted MPP superfamily phosphohydrolase
MRILHISDIHFGLRHDDGVRDIIQMALLECVQGLSFDVAVITGDIANKGLDQEYVAAKDFCDALVSGGKQPLLIVPGNHDVDRTQAQSSDLVNAAKSVDDFSRTEPALLAPSRFRAFQRFSENYRLDWRSDITSASTTIGSVAFVAINTALLCHQKDEERRLALHAHRLNDRLGSVYTSDTTTICLGHHPLTWMAEWNEQLAMSALRRGVRGAHLYLHGHLHDPQGQVSAEVTGSALCTFAAGASYVGSSYPHSFWLIELKPDVNLIEPNIYRYSSANGTFDRDPSTSRSLPTLLRTSTRTGSVAAAQSTTPTPPLPLNGARELLRHLEKNFGVIWEPTPDTVVPTDIFWPVRLREPTLIHAGQAFIAAALQRTGCQIHLCLDDLGRAECASSKFEDRISAHFRRADADFNKVRVTRTTELLEQSTFSDTWQHFSQWMSKASNLGEALEVCKLMTDGSNDFGAVVGKKPRKLMTPAVVWTAFALCKKTHSDSNQWITLGGFDERRLWSVWKGIFNPPPTDHVYLSTLAPLSQHNSQGVLTMADEPLHWISRSDIESTLKRDDQPPSAPQHLLGWLIRYCLLLPARLRNTTLTLGGREIVHPIDLLTLDNVPRHTLLDDVTDSTRDVLLS